MTDNNIMNPADSLSTDFKRVHDWIMSIDDNFDVINFMENGDSDIYMELNGIFL